jgi:hypothetical protein
MKLDVCATRLPDPVFALFDAEDDTDVELQLRGDGDWVAWRDAKGRELFRAPRAPSVA